MLSFLFWVAPVVACMFAIAGLTIEEMIKNDTSSIKIDLDISAGICFSMIPLVNWLFLILLVFGYLQMRIRRMSFNYYIVKTEKWIRIEHREE